jgi:hypothetical protein
LTFIGASRHPRFGFQLIEEDPSRFVSSSERDTKYASFLPFEEWKGVSERERRSAEHLMLRAVRQISQHVRIKDYFAIDFRLGADLTPHAIDFNPGAFLCGDDVEEYTRRAFGMTLSEALLTAMRSSYLAWQQRAFTQGKTAFRL